MRAHIGVLESGKLSVRTHTRTDSVEKADRVIVTPQMVEEMKRLRKLRWSRAAIASKLGLAIKTVRNHLWRAK
jgi:DNA-binding transcriptional ArsR family regulator